MTPRQLRYFTEIARQLSFTKASKVLHVTQPALSRQIQDLENALGTQVFTRSDIGLGLTAAGKLLAERAPAILNALHQVEIDVQGLSGEPAGALKFGIVPSLFEKITAPATIAFRQKYSSVKMTITEGSSSALFEAITHGQLDFAIVSANESTSGVVCRPLLKEQMYLASKPGVPGEKNQRIDLKTVQPLPLIASAHPNSMRRLLDEGMRGIGQRANVVLETSSVKLMASVAAAGLAHTVLPYSALAEPVGQGLLQVRAIDNLFASWVLIHARNLEPTPAINALINIILDISIGHKKSGSWPNLTVLAGS